VDSLENDMIPRLPLFLTLLLMASSAPIPTFAQQDNSLGVVARQLRAEKKSDTSPALVFTNDNLPPPKPDEAISVLSTPQETTIAPAKSAVSEEKSAPKEESPTKPGEPGEDKVKTQDFWQSRFTRARLDVARAKEHEQLSEDELNLLQIRQVRELDPMAKDDLDAQVKAKQSEVDVNTATTEAAQKALDELAKQFEASGAPEDWSKTD
jgi:hypothetical protein